MTISLTVDRWNPSPYKISKAARVINAGGLVAFPTETVYGLGADGLNPKAVSKIFTAKGRPQDNPLLTLLHVWRMTQAYQVVEFTPASQSPTASPPAPHPPLRYPPPVLYCHASPPAPRICFPLP